MIDNHRDRPAPRLHRLRRNHIPFDEQAFSLCIYCFQLCDCRFNNGRIFFYLPRRLNFDIGGEKLLSPLVYQNRIQNWHLSGLLYQASEIYSDRPFIVGPDPLTYGETALQTRKIAA